MVYSGWKFILFLGFGRMTSNFMRLTFSTLCSSHSVENGYHFLIARKSQPRPQGAFPGFGGWGVTIFPSSLPMGPRVRLNPIANLCSPQKDLNSDWVRVCKRSIFDCLKKPLTQTFACMATWAESFKAWLALTIG